MSSSVLDSEITSEITATLGETSRAKKRGRNFDVSSNKKSNEPKVGVCLSSAPFVHLTFKNTPFPLSRV